MTQPTSTPEVIHVFDNPKRKRFLIHPFTDFWLLGGASILLFIALYIGIQIRDSSQAVQSRFYQLGMAFAMLSLVCNHPHFIISYKFGYGRGWKFIFKHWFSLVFVPIALVAAYVVAYTYFDTDISESRFVSAFNSYIDQIGLRFQIGIGDSLGWEILALTVWLMYLTVGWHYSKQVYGCMMVYAHFDQYKLSTLEKRLIRLSLYSIAFFQFIYMTQYFDQSATGGDYSADMRFPGVKMSVVGVPEIASLVSGLLVTITSTLLVIVFIRKFLRSRTAPSLNFLIPWVSFHFWWVFMFLVPEFVLIVPFFHSLQYLPFAYTLEASSIKHGRWLYANISARVIGLLLIGFLAFEFMPNKIDSWLETDILKAPFFFLSAAVIFINVHHFFIDSVAWKLSDKKVRDVFT